MPEFPGDHDMKTTQRRAILAAPFFVRNLISAPPSGRVRLASFGANGMAWATLNGIATHPSVDLIAAADVDTERTGRVKTAYAKATLYQDWRKMLDKEYKNLVMKIPCRVRVVNANREPEKIHAEICQILSENESLLFSDSRREEMQETSDPGRQVQCTPFQHMCRLS